jgi:hypothetical protein
MRLNLKVIFYFQNFPTSYLNIYFCLIMMQRGYQNTLNYHQDVGSMQPTSSNNQESHHPMQYPHFDNYYPNLVDPLQYLHLSTLYKFIGVFRLAL